MKSYRETGDIIRYTTCGWHCYNMCILKVRIRDGVIIACEPDDTINPNIAREDAYLPEATIDQGMIQTRPCVRGYAQARMIYDPKRVRYPMKRVGRRGEARFERISWDEALDTIAEKLVYTREKYGPLSILHHPYSTQSVSSFPLAPWFGAGFAGWLSHSLNGWEEPRMWVLGKGAKPRQIEIPGSSLENQDETNIFKSRLIVLWGFNPAATLAGAFVYNLLRARERGIPIISIESRYTPTVEVLANQWIPIRPTTDTAMMVAMANVWFKEDLCDREFIARWVEPEGLRRWKAYVLGESDRIDKTPAWAETICGVPAETITEFARLYARSKPVNLNISCSTGRQFFGENTARASMYLQALTGNSCTPGGTAASDTWWNPGHLSFPPPAVDWQQKPGSYKSPVLLCGYKWTKAIDLREKLDNGKMTREEYNNILGSAPQSDPLNIQMVILEGNNHLNTLPDMNGNIRAIKKVGFVVVFSHYAEQDSARYADILLPMIHTAFEGLDCQFAGRNVTSRFHAGQNLANYVIYAQKCVEPPGEIKGRHWFWTQIAKRLGLADFYNPRLADVPEGDWDAAIEELHHEGYDKWTKREEIKSLNPPAWQEFLKKPVFRWKITDPYYAFKDDLDIGENPFHGTPSGKIEFYSRKLAEGPEYLASHEFFPGSGKYYGSGNLPPMAEMTLGGKDAFHSPDTRKYPLLLSSPHSLYRIHSLLFNETLLRGDCYRHAVWISAADAKARDIKDDDRVRVYNDLGEMVIRAYVTSRVVPGTAYLFHGGWYQPGEDKSRLMPDGIDLGGAPNLLTHNEDVPQTIVGFYPCKGLVQIEKWESK